MKITVYAVISCIPERGEPPVWPAMFGTLAEAEAHAEKQLQEEWQAVGEWDDDEDRLADYPGNWREANDKLRAKFSDGSWGEYQLVTQEIDAPLPTDISEALRNAGSAIGVLDEQISQMEGMFDDEDGQIADARQEGDEAWDAIQTVLEGEKPRQIVLEPDDQQNAA